MNVYRSLEAMPQNFHFRVGTKSCNPCRYFIYPCTPTLFHSVPLKSLVWQHFACSGIIEPSLVMLITCEHLLWVIIQKCLVNILGNISELQIQSLGFSIKLIRYFIQATQITFCWCKDVTCSRVRLSFYTVSRCSILVPQGFSVLLWYSILFHCR